MQQPEFEHHVPHWRSKALAVSRACGAQAAEADDVAQEVLLKLWMMRNELERYRSIEALVSVMSRNLTIGHLRRQRMVGLDDLVQVSDNGSPLQQLIDHEEEQRLMNLVNALPSSQHAVLVMRQVEHRPYDEIASLIGISETSARTLLSRARKALLRRIQEGNDP